MFMKIHRQVLDVLIELMPNFEEFNEFKFYTSPAVAEIHIDILPEVLRDLEVLGYVRCIVVSGENIVQNVSLTLAGRYYEKHCRRKVFRFIRDSFIVPVAASILTSALLYFCAL